MTRVVGREEEMPSWWLLGLDPLESKAGSADGDVGEERDDHLVGVRDQRRWDQPLNQACQRQARLQNVVDLPPTVQHQNEANRQSFTCHRSFPSALRRHFQFLAFLARSSGQQQ